MRHVSSTAARVEVLWPNEDHYYAGCVGRTAPDGRRGMHFEAGENEDRNLHEEMYHYGSAVQPHLPPVTSQLPAVRTSMLSHFC